MSDPDDPMAVDTTWCGFCLIPGPADQPIRHIPRCPTVKSAVVDVDAIDRLTRRLLHTSMHNRCTIAVAGRIQDDVNELRKIAGLAEFGWNDAVPDQEVGRCSVHLDGCLGQHTHDTSEAA